MTNQDKILAIDDVTTQVLIGDMSVEDALEIILMILTENDDKIWH